MNGGKMSSRGVGRKTGADKKQNSKNQETVTTGVTTGVTGKLSLLVLAGISRGKMTEKILTAQSEMMAKGTRTTKNGAAMNRLTNTGTAKKTETARATRATGMMDTVGHAGNIGRAAIITVISLFG